MQTTSLPGSVKPWGGSKDQGTRGGGTTPPCGASLEVVSSLVSQPSGSVTSPIRTELKESGGSEGSCVLVGFAVSAPHMRPGLLIGLWSLVGLLAACGKRSEGKEGVPSAEPQSPVVPTEPATAAQKAVELLDLLETCEVRHRGLSIDLGTEPAHSLRSFSVGPLAGALDVERSGSTMVRFLEREARYDFWLDEEQAEGVFLSLRVHGGASERVAVYVDAKLTGVVRLKRGETKIAQLPSLRFALARGRHTVLLRFSGTPQHAKDFYAEVDWIRIGAEDDSETTYSAPTLGDVITDHALDGRPQRSLVFRGASSLRCPVRPTPGAELRVNLGFWGAGKGTAEIRVVEDGVPLTLQQRRVMGGTGARWVPLRLSLGQFEGRVVGLEFRALEATGGGRVVFGEPTIGLTLPPGGEVPKARTVVLVVAAGLSRQQIPPWGKIGALAALGELGRVGVAFSGYRVPTTVPAGVVASMLTGLPPRAHALEDQAARLPDAVRTVNEIVKAAGGRTAFFTASPATFVGFGLGSGWDQYEMFSPVEDQSALAPIERTARWLEQGAGGADHVPQLAVLHLRGAHPPWDLSKKEVETLPPEEYGGSIDARRGGITLGKIRRRERLADRRLTPEEWTRLRALEQAALLHQDAALATLIADLKRLDLWGDCLFIFVGDVAQGDPPAVPYAPAGELSEDRLLVPLIVKFPGAPLETRETTAPTTSVDLAVTILRALDLKVPEHVVGEDLHRASNELGSPIGRPLVATLGPHYATRLGTWLLAGQVGETPTLCQLDVDPACVTDAFEERPIVAQGMWRWTYRELRQAALRRLFEREPAPIEPQLAAALTVWGDIP